MLTTLHKKCSRLRNIKKKNSLGTDVRFLGLGIKKYMTHMYVAESCHIDY